MDNDPVQFSFIIVAGKLFGIGAYRIKADKEIAAQAVAFAIVKSDDVGIIIMLKILPVYFENFLVRAKNIGDFTDSFFIGGSNGFNLFRCFPFLDCRHFDAVRLITYHIVYYLLEWAFFRKRIYS